MTPTATTRTLSTAEDRREAVLVAAERIFPARGLLATPTLEVAKGAGISQAYLFRLFPTKADLAIALVERCNARVHQTFVEAAARAHASGEDPLLAMGSAYMTLLGDRDLLLLQLHAHAASAHVPEIRDAMRAGFKRLVEFVGEQTDDPAEVQTFFAHGMLLNVLAAMDVQALDEPWVKLLMKHEAC